MMEGELFFLLGLGSFLLTQLCYSLAFAKMSDAGSGLLRRKPLLAVPLLLYGFLFVRWLWPDLPGVLAIAVAIYAGVITLMGLSALHLRGRIPKAAFWMIFAGALLFITSDSLIAANRFKADIPAARLLIMSTYLLGQFGIISGSLRAIRAFAPADSAYTDRPPAR